MNHRESEEQVSIPYRQATGQALSLRDPMLATFQFLIGRLQALLVLCKGLISFKFQFLIGRLQASEEAIDVLWDAGFNSL